MEFSTIVVIVLVLAITYTLVKSFGKKKQAEASTVSVADVAATAEVIKATPAVKKSTPAKKKPTVKKATTRKPKAK